MWSVKAINWMTNIFGTIAGVPEILSGILKINDQDYGHGIKDICMGLGILAVGYFTGKSAMSGKPQ